MSIGFDTKLVRHYKNKASSNCEFSSRIKYIVLKHGIVSKHRIIIVLKYQMIRKIKNCSSYELTPLNNSRTSKYVLNFVCFICDDKTMFNRKFQFLIRFIEKSDSRLPQMTSKSTSFCFKLHSQQRLCTHLEEVVKYIALCGYKLLACQTCAGWEAVLCPFHPGIAVLLLLLFFSISGKNVGRERINKV